MRMGSAYLSELCAIVVRCASMWSIAGMMVARLGTAPDEKNIVESLNTWTTYEKSASQNASARGAIRSVWVCCVKCQRRALTFSTLRSCRAILHSPSFSSKLRKPFALFPHNISMAFLYFSATSSISYVEFHRVFTSRGSNLSAILNVCNTSFQAGSNRVVELTILKDSFRI